VETDEQAPSAASSTADDPTPGDPISPTTFRISLSLPSVQIEDVYLVIRFTRHWIHYGFISHIAVCVLIAAAEGLLGR